MSASDNRSARTRLAAKAKVGKNAMSLKDPFGDHSGSQRAINARLGISDADAAKYGGTAVNATEPDGDFLDGEHKHVGVTAHGQEHKTLAHHQSKIEAHMAKIGDSDDHAAERQNLAELAAHCVHAMACQSKALTPPKEDEQDEPKDASAVQTRYLDHNTGKFVG